MRRHSRTILIVDDSPEDREVYRRYLQRDQEYSYNFLEAALGQQGLEVWQQHQPDAVLLDYCLPDLDGLEFLSELQSSSQPSYLPVIMVTGYGNEAIAVQSLKAGAQDYLVKEQITPEKLHIAVNSTINTVKLRNEVHQLYQQAQHELAERKRTEAALRESEERFRQLAENINAVFWINELPQRQVSYVSPGYERLWGLDRQAVYDDHQNWINLIHPQDRQAIERAFQEQAFAGKFDHEYRIILPDGTIRWVRDRCFPVHDHLGRVCRLTGIAEDITDRKRQEINKQFLRQLDLRLRHLSEAPAMIWETLSSLGAYLEVNVCTLGRIDWQQGLICIEQHWCPGLPNNSGNYLVSDFITPELQLTFASGQTAVIHDVTKDSGTAAFARNYELSQIRAFVSVPCIYQGSWVASLTISSATPRVWRQDEVALLQETVAHIWPLIEQTKALQALRESEERFRLSVETMLDCFGIYRAIRDQQGQIIDFLIEYVNEAACYQNQMTCQQQIGQPLCKLLPAIRASKLFDEFCQVVETGQALVKESLIYENLHGQQHLGKAFDLRVAKFGDGIIVTWRDVSDRKRSELELQESQFQLQQQLAQIEAIYESAPIGLAVLDYELRFVRINHYLAQINGLPIAAHIGRSVREILPGLIDSAEQPLRSILETGEPLLNVKIKGETPAQPGVQRTWLEHFLPLKNGNQVVGISLVCEEITERLEIEQERSRLLQQEQIARAEAERANRLKDEFLAILSHELRSPLNPILGWATLLQTRKFDEATTAEALSTIERNAKLQTQLIDDLLDVAKILRGKLSMNVAPVNLVFVIESAIETVRTAAIAKSILLSSVIPQIGQVSGDAARLQQIFWNLLSNAIKFTPTNGRVDIRLERIGNQAQITISDTGKGINPHFLPYIFESFRQEDASTTRKYGGLGLGLAIVRHLVEAHGGTITAESKGEEQGATFTVRLPLLNPKPEHSQADQLIKSKQDLTGIKVLTVDDEPDSRELFTALLTQYGAEVLTVASAAEVLTSLEFFQPDVLVSDIGMPDMDGYALLQQIRSLPPEKGGQIPAIALTAYARTEEQQRSQAVGFQCHIPKPLDLDKLVQAVSTLARQH